MKVSCTCTYCGHCFNTYIYTEDTEVLCQKCNDKNVKISREKENKDIFGYKSQEPKPDAYIRKNK